MNDTWRGRWKDVSIDQIELVKAHLRAIMAQSRLTKLPGDIDGRQINSMRPNDILDYAESLLSGDYGWHMPAAADEELVGELRAIIARKIT